VEMTEENWRDGSARCVGLLLDGRVGTRRIKDPGCDVPAFLVVNSHEDVVRFKLPEVAGGREWERLIDTNLPAQEERVPFAFGQEYETTAHSLLLFALRTVSHKGANLRAQA
jgi:isoamylase